MTDPAPLRLAVLLSGSGRTLDNLLERIAAGSLAARVEAVVASRADVRGVRIAAAAAVPVTVLPPAGRPVDAWSEEIFAACPRLATVGIITARERVYTLDDEQPVRPACPRASGTQLGDGARQAWGGIAGRLDRNREFALEVVAPELPALPARGDEDVHGIVSEAFGGAVGDDEGAVEGGDVNA